MDAQVPTKLYYLDLMSRTPTKVLLFGDSLVAQDLKIASPNAHGWGEYLQSLLRTPVVNMAVAGESAKSFYDRHHEIFTRDLFENSVVLLSFAHNDSYTPGPNFISPELHKTYLEKFFQIITECGGSPVVVHPPMRWTPAPLTSPCDLAPYVNIQQQITKTKFIATIDLYNLSHKRLKTLKPSESALDYSMWPIRPDTPDVTHLSAQGASFYAKVVYEFLKDSGLQNFSSNDVSSKG